MMKIIAALLMFIPVLSLANDDMYPEVPCERKVVINDRITRIVLPMTPFRGVNLIFPFKMNDDEVVYSISSDSLWETAQAKGTNVIPITFSEFDVSRWNTVHDLSIGYKDEYVFSIALTAKKVGHCTNVVFILSEKEKKRIEEKEKKDYLEKLDREYKKKLEALDLEASKRVLISLGEVVRSSPNKTRINEEQSLEQENGDEFVVYVRDIKRYGKFNTVSFDLELDTAYSDQVVYIRDIKLFNLKDGKRQGRAIDGVVKYDKKMKGDTSQELMLSTLDALSDTDLVLVVETDKGDVEVVW
ncbi:MAG: hypothetical protein HRU20_21605 [Pseudomonadales bacterium]|nr:hypothetical protein [Pseudomonadales bacterium]